MNDRNKNKTGYKETKVGWIPEEWEVKPFCHVIETSQYGLSINTSKEGQTPILRMCNIEDGKIKYKNLLYVNISDEEQLKYMIKKDDLFFNRTNSLEHVGKMGIVTTVNAAVFASYLVRFQMKNSLAFPAFIAYFFDASESRNKLKKIATQGVCQYNINQSELQRQFIVSLPPLSEQKKIAEILSTWDEAIEQTRKLINAKKHCKKALMQQLLTGKRRLLGFHEPWKKNALGDMFDERNETSYEHLPLLAITGKRGVIPASEIERKDSSSEAESLYKRIAVGDIGYNTMRMWQGVSAVSRLEGIVSPAYTVCIPKDGVDVAFIGHLFKFPPVINLFRMYSQGLVNDTLNLKFHNFAQIKIKIPQSNEQQCIAEIISTADAEIEALEKKLAALEKQKCGLMQKLLTGEIRVKTE